MRTAITLIFFKLLQSIGMQLSQARKKLTKKFSRFEISNELKSAMKTLSLCLVKRHSK